MNKMHINVFVQCKYTVKLKFHHFHNCIAFINFYLVHLYILYSYNRNIMKKLVGTKCFQLKQKTND